MARHYGFTCDVCGWQIASKADHRIITIETVLPKETTQFDICPKCLNKSVLDFKGIGRACKLDVDKII